MADNTTVAVLGTGIMGAAMARNLLEAGMEVRVWNRTREKAEPLADDSARVAERAPRRLQKRACAWRSPPASPTR
jgi:3-hydroxyisobutyrate dehydrogenase